MAELSWSESDLSPEDAAELAEAIRVADEMTRAGSTSCFGGDTGRSLLAEVQGECRQILAERKRAS